jgi:hypothetical protein
MIPAMSFESLGRRERPQDNDRGVNRLERDQEVTASWKDRVERTARLAGLAAAIAAPAGLAQAGEINFSNAADQGEVTRMLTETPSSGKITLASGESVKIPTTADHFNKVTVFSPREGHAWRVVILFQQNHLHTAEEMQGFSTDARRAALDAVERSQKIIYEEIETLGKKGTIKSVCQEGIIASPDNKSAKELTKSLTDPELFDTLTTELVAPYLSVAHDATTEYFDLFKREGGLDITGLVEIKTHLEPIFHTIGKQYPHVLGAAEIAASKGVIPLCAAEEQATYDGAWSPDVSAIMARPSTQWTPEEAKLIKEKVVDDREDAALRQTLNQKGSVVAIEFGAAHTFTAATARWNEAHPHQQVMLVQADAFQAIAPVTVSVPQNGSAELK